MAADTAQSTTVPYSHPIPSKPTNSLSNTLTKILVLCLHDLRLLPPNKHIPHPTPHTLRASLRNLPPPHTPLLPIDTPRTTAHHPPHRNPHPLRPRATHSQAQCEFGTLWRCQPLDIRPVPTRIEDMAADVVVESFWIYSHAVGAGTFICQ